MAATKQQVTTLQTKVTTAAAAARTTKVATKAKAATPAKSAIVATGSLTGIGAAAAKYLGTPYRAGGASPAGFDCSGLVWYAAKQIGVSLPRTAGGMSTRGQAVSFSHLKAGDLLFWGGVGSAYHVAIYIGGGRYIHSPQPGQSVRIQSMGSYGPSFARRL